MSILIVDDENPDLIKAMLQKAGYADFLEATAALDAIRLLGELAPEPSDEHPVQLILLNVFMRDVDGIEACRIIRNDPRFEAIPIVMLTSEITSTILNRIFDAGALDYLEMPINNLALLARLRSVFILRKEIAKGRSQAHELAQTKAALDEAVKRVARFSITDSLTGVTNRRQFEALFGKEWLRAMRYGSSLSLIFLEVNNFKAFLEEYGQEQSNQLLKALGSVLQMELRRATDLLARYEGQIFVILLPETPFKDAETMAERLRLAVSELKWSQESIKGKIVTASVGSVSGIILKDRTPEAFIGAAEEMLLAAQKGNGLCICNLDESVET